MINILHDYILYILYIHTFSGWGPFRTRFSLLLRFLDALQHEVPDGLPWDM